MEVYAKQNYRGLIFVAVAGAVVGFVAGHALGAQLTQGTLKAAIEAAGSQILRSTNEPVVLAMGIQAATAIACAAIVPAITTDMSSSCRTLHNRQSLWPMQNS